MLIRGVNRLLPNFGMLPVLPALLQTVDLSCERDDRLLIDRLNLSVHQGHIYQIEGPNGSGKTTLLRVLCGLSTRYTGDLLWQSRSVKQSQVEFLSSLLYIGHQPGIKSTLTPRENLSWHVSVKGNHAGANIDKALVQVGLYGFEDAPCYSLSAGQQRRVSLARLFLNDCPLWILDEPFTAIDKQGVAELEGWIEQHAANGGAVVITTHHELSFQHEHQRVTLGG